ncbi:bifunctional tRNA (5-methylaminomethyl-2-thiouridine)(34)-methyltransferase MnmD/FAD-dependent 5-carboxymethylaminomethyl-2-thiouridine(34) oxidoreductase MnmC [Rheinheimera sp. MMS21-TC3]|uniref:bifunctional tRNA (5-methylaminomethyl-2-thiouridine)(34)-methyltransferase MnmD/FAD-dependent 5-carboxymethylaminomethyl-2-thiouridine(34) oxidoreductase MnmC n=1 Tax=Rheinheimera sp. MMS21-TC3 TaxID=3072790 RepID=UPI0028C47CFF|nr:bifunctional tRNA (5-methylaminomethyl-2-thiouridine)(34)-methyltransferase MnmD/FAD-dependent 5-carboxymethylaminomethyl-2-thiouridine(34) oxidoreductase MnmC [Rheinheimera sp. MMS21-TC3]WNO60026.1 bifunctional tRNA (5-methylaminomethyl-2-thiouridine)(34)-methyltransferase MnmD/FAD-dependent 5-carboxymethylaminomethyl-2-thiouridine(34) oxidoreductase MnmC [Rheinheimera sp. MMS21-TC3]
MSQLSYANVHFNAAGIPYAEDFADAYCSDAGGLAETDYVFLQQNGLPQRWQSHTQAVFHIIETGFGTGANFLLTWLRFCQFKQQNPNASCQRLHFTSVEKYPLTPADLQQALAIHPELQPFAQQLIKQYPPCIAGCHRLVFDQGAVIVDLWFGDVSTVMPNLAAADAVFLDGFAPSKNPQMWQPSLFSALARLSHPNTTIATFTAAGSVKRGLEEAGFTVKKVKGFGRKREMITATIPTSAVNFTNTLNNNAPPTVTIIGGGIASLCTALALQQRNIAVHLICADHDVAMQASQNRQGVIYPNLPAEVSATSLLQVQAFLFARQFYQIWQQQGLDFKMDFCGMLHLATTARLEQRQAKLATFWPNTLVSNVTAEQATELAGLNLQQNAVYYPLAGWLNPKQFCQAALAFLQQQANFRFSNNSLVKTLEPNNNSWVVNCESKQFNSDYIVLATGSALASFTATKFLPMNIIRGQVSHISQQEMHPLKTVICHAGYITPQWQGLHSIGATFDRKAKVAAVKAADNCANLQQINEQLNSPTWLKGATVQGAAAAFRASLPDRWPIAGEIQPALFALGGLGARGIMFSPLLAEIIACQICAEPLPLTKEQFSSLDASRFTNKNK